MAQKCGKVITCEEHNIIGGLGEAVCALLSEKCPTPVRRIGVNDEFGHSGPAAALLKQFRPECRAHCGSGQGLLQVKTFQQKNPGDAAEHPRDSFCFIVENGSGGWKRGFRHGGHLPQDPKLNGNGAGQGAGVGYGLGHLESRHAQQGGENPHQGDEEDALAGHGQEGGRSSAADGLEHHIAHDNPALEEEGDTLEAQRGGAAGHHVGIIPEEGHQFRGQRQSPERRRSKERRWRF